MNDYGLFDRLMRGITDFLLGEEKSCREEKSKAVQSSPLQPRVLGDKVFG